MANPTTYFGWVMPTTTDLVTDLPADFNVFGQGVDTSMQDLLGGTTGQVLSKATGTNMDFTWVTPQVGDITDVAVTSPITGGGSSGAVTIGIQDASTTVKGATQLTDSTSSTSTTTAATPNAVKTAYDLANGAIAKTTVTTAGDIIYRNATVPTRLAIGTAGQVLQVNSGATAPEWTTASSGGMTLISTTSLSGASVTLSSFTGYTDLQLIVIGAYPATTQNTFFCRFNSDSGNNYFTGAMTQGSTSSTFTKVTIGDGISNSSTNVTSRNYSVINIQKYAGTEAKPCQVQSGYIYWSNSAQNYMWSENSVYIGSSAITTITLSFASGNFSGGTAYLYGVK